MKTKLVELHRERKNTGFTLRYTVHDEVDGDVPNEESAKKVTEVLNSQSFPDLKVPILWDVQTGSNWAECK
jgi:DNA polymerase I-like protein with 3'-5' exonuclease and polymerase domains